MKGFFWIVYRERRSKLSRWLIVERATTTYGSVGGLDGGSTLEVAWSRKERSKEGTAPALRCKVDQGETCERQR